ncbi:hypothetical protein F4779DRAFT_569417 [Xylariaceae sp. FL0662B]|nr:hypothetical protein F4779DRAFT_569417 [Xylariaceae sp. FL0662B]
MALVQLPHYYAKAGSRLRPYEPPEFHYTMGETIGGNYRRELEGVYLVLLQTSAFFVERCQVSNLDEAALLLQKLEFTVVAFEEYRLKDELQHYCHDHNLPTGGSDAGLLTKMTVLADARESLVNFLLLTNVYSHLRWVQMEGWDQATRDAEKAYEERYRTAKARTDSRLREAKKESTKLMEAFWGDVQAELPLPGHVNRGQAVSDRAGWADPIDAKLETMALRIKEDPQVIKDAF